VPRPSKSDLRRNLVLRVTGSLFVLSVLFVVLPLDQLATALGRVPAWVWAVSLPGYLTLHLIGISKWRMLVNAAEGGMRLEDAIRCYYLGLFGNTFLPSLVGGDAVRAGMALKLAPGKGGVLFGSLLDRVIDVGALALVAGVGAALIPGALDPQSRRVFWLLAIMISTAGAVGAVLLLVLPARRFPYRVRRIMVTLRRSLTGLRRRPWTVIAAFSMGVALQTFLVGLNWWLGHQCGIDIAFNAWLFAWPMAKISALVPLTQGGIGVREAALATLLAPFGVPAVLAVAAGLVFQGVILSGGLTAGLVSFLLGRAR